MSPSAEIIIQQVNIFYRWIPRKCFMDHIFLTRLDTAEYKISEKDVLNPWMLFGKLSRIFKTQESVIWTLDNLIQRKIQVISIEKFFSKKSGRKDIRND